MAGAAWFALTAHSPYGQWDTFRKSRLIVFADAQDARSQQVAQALAARLEAALPATRATWARAPNALELVKLLESHQADVILLPPEAAAQARNGQGRFSAIGSLPLHRLAAAEGYLLTCLGDYPATLAWQLAQALGPTEGSAELPVHPGAAAHAQGLPMPAVEPHTHKP